jgi:hypothetical protein
MAGVYGQAGRGDRRCILGVYRDIVRGYNCVKGRVSSDNGI